MPTRYLKAGIRDSELIDSLSPLAETFYYRLLVTVDDFGRFDARPAMIKAQCFPIKESVTVKNCSDMLKELADSGLIDIYEVDGKSVLQIFRNYDGDKRRPKIEDWKLLRKKIFQRDNFTCFYCTQHGGNLECDHKTPIALGGDSEDSNLVTSCKSCNRKKGAMSFGDWMKSIKVDAL